MLHLLKSAFVVVAGSVALWAMIAYAVLVDAKRALFGQPPVFDGEDD